MSSVSLSMRRSGRGGGPGRDMHVGRPAWLPPPVMSAVLERSEGGGAGLAVGETWRRVLRRHTTLRGVCGREEEEEEALLRFGEEEERRTDRRQHAVKTGSPV